MEFIVDIVTTRVKRVRIQSDSAQHAATAVSHLDDAGALLNVPVTTVTTEYKPRAVCAHCGKPTGMYLTNADEAFCISCYERLVQSWKNQLPA